MNQLWQLFKAILTVLLLVLAVCIIALPGPITEFERILMLSLFSLLSVALWLDYAKLQYNPKFAAIFVSFFPFVYSILILSGEVQFPKNCEGRRKMLCLFDNLLFSLGGTLVVAIFWLTFATILAYVMYTSSTKNSNLR